MKRQKYIDEIITALVRAKRIKNLYNNLDISKVELYSLRRQIGIVPQDPLFAGSVSENIGLTDPEATSEEIIRAADCKTHMTSL